MPTTPDLSTYSDEELATLRDAVSTETIRRDRLRALPMQARQCALDYEELGGDRADLVDAINAAEAAKAAELLLAEAQA